MYRKFNLKNQHGSKSIGRYMQKTTNILFIRRIFINNILFKNVGKNLKKYLHLILE